MDLIFTQLTRTPFLALRTCIWLVVTSGVGAISHADELVDSSQPTSTTKTIYTEFKTPEGNVSCTAEVLIEYSGGSLLLGSDGQMWTVKTEDVISSEVSPESMRPATSNEIFQQFRQQLPPGFSVHRTKHYVLVYNTSKAYVTWVGKLYERLHKSFYNFWKNKGIQLDEPRFPLVAVVFSNKQSYLRFAQREIGDSAKAMIGYYNMKTNRMITYDMTGVDGMVPRGRQVSSPAMINKILSQPGAERTVATIVHEAVHQLAFNSSLQVRLADNPYWVSEGMAMFFEAPDPHNRAGWGRLGLVNYHNLKLFRANLPSRTGGQFVELITDDTKFQDAKSAGQFYPESWALTYYLIKTHREQYFAYITELRSLKPQQISTARERLDCFEKHFGAPAELEREFLKYIPRIR